MKQLFISICVAIISFSFFFVPSVNAQGIIPYTIEDAQGEASLILNPKYPKPHEPFMVSVESYAIDLNSSRIDFYENNTLLQSGVGQKSAEYSNTAKTTNVRVKITTKEGFVVEKTRTVVPGSVTLLWQADTYTPPFYRGRALLTDEASFYVRALADIKNVSGTAYSPQNLVFTWEINGSVRGTISGTGKDTICIDERFLSGFVTVGVTVASQDGVSISTSNIVIPIVQPTVVMYPFNSLQGTNWSSSMAHTQSTESEISVRAVPYFFSVSPNKLTYSWTANGAAIDVGGQVATFRNESNIASEVRINVAVENMKSFFERARGSLTIETLSQ